MQRCYPLKYQRNTQIIKSGGIPMFKKLGLATISLMFAISLAGCGADKTSAPAESNAKQTTAASSSVKDNELVVVVWGGTVEEVRKKTIFEPFEKKYGAKITMVTPTDYGKFKAMVQGGNVEWDVVNTDVDFVIRGAKEGLLEKLDYSVINKEGIIKELVHEYGVGQELFSTAISYNTKTFSGDQHPSSWSDFWDTKKFPGPRALWKYPVGALEAALLADGVKPAELYPLDVDRAFKSLDKLKKDVKVWWNAGAQPVQLLSSGEVAMTSAWSGRITMAKSEGAPVNVEYNQGLIFGDSWVIPKGSKHKDLAQKFIAFAVSPEVQADFSSHFDNAPANLKALDLMPDDIKERLGQSPESAKKQVLIDYTWWVANFDKVNERFQQWLLN
jgi:putative spermidine/putrescine transport system substrate-binding protein